MFHGPSGGESSSSCMHGGRRRRTMSLATAAAALTASVSTAGVHAFSSPSSSAATTTTLTLSSYAYTRHSPRLTMPPQRQRPSLHSSSLGMVSYLQAPPALPPPLPPRKKKRRSQQQSPNNKKYDYLVFDDMGLDSASRSRNQQPDDDHVVVDNSAAWSSDLTNGQVPPLRHAAPDIDSEILYEGIITSAPSAAPSVEFSSSSTTKISTTTSEDSPMTAPTATTTATDLPTATINPATTKSMRSRSSTMPGFIKDSDLDEQIANLGLRRLPPTSLSQRKLTTRRMTRSKSAKLHRRQANSESLYKKSASVPDSLLTYAHEFHSIHRVTPTQEKELGSKTQEAIRLQRLHTALQNKYGRHPTDDEWCAAAGKINVLALKEAIDDGLQAKNQLVASNLRMVQRVVNLYIRNGLGSEYNAGDLMQDGTMVRVI